MIREINKKCRMFSSLNKTNISVTEIGGERFDYYNFDIPNFIEKKIEIGLEELFDKHGPLLDHQVILYKDRIKICWLIYIFEDKELKNSIVRLGPFLNEVVLDAQFKYYGHCMKLSVDNIRILQNLYSKIPVYEENEIRNIFSIFTNLLKSNMDDIELIIERKEQDMPGDNKYSDRFTQYEFASQNYDMEAKIMGLIEKGDIEKIKEMLKKKVAEFKLPTRHRNDPLRNAKNLSITLNSISARAALKGGLNPNLVHSISTKYAIEIEKQINVSNIEKLNISIIYEYCESVKKYSLAGYSPIVKKAISYIRRNLSNTISLMDIASNLHVNKAYLSRAFKKETDNNVTDYIHQVKIHESLDLVKSGSYDITDLAVMFGYCNTAYFSTQFKKIMEMSPRAYQKGSDSGSYS